MLTLYLVMLQPTLSNKLMVSSSSSHVSCVRVSQSPKITWFDNHHRYKDATNNLKYYNVPILLLTNVIDYNGEQVSKAEYI